MISIVIPLYNEQESLSHLVEKIREVIAKEQYEAEIIFVDDGSTDDSLKILQQLREQYPELIRIISFRKNYGKSAALSVGFRYASGEVIITMDADLQDDPEEIPRLIAELEKGYDLVSGWKKKRYDPINKTLPSRFFNFVTSKLTGIPLHDFNCGLKAYRKEVVEDIPVYGELHRFLPVLANWQGYRVGEIPVRHHPRRFGKTKFGISRFFHGFFDLITVLFITRYRKTPLYIFGGLGSVFFLTGFLVELYLSILKLSGTVGITRRPLFFLGILLIIVGIQFFSLGLLGDMISSHFAEKQDYSIKWKSFSEELGNRRN